MNEHQTETLVNALLQATADGDTSLVDMLTPVAEGDPDAVAVFVEAVGEGPREKAFDESKVKRETAAHDDKRPGEFAPKEGGGDGGDDPHKIVESVGLNPGEWRFIDEAIADLNEKGVDGEKLVQAFIDAKRADIFYIRNRAAISGKQPPTPPAPRVSAGSKTGVKRGRLTKLKPSQLTFPGGLSDEVTPLHDGNSDMPIIVKKQGDKYAIVDGFGRASGIKNAGGSQVHAIVVSDADLDANDSGQGDDPEWVSDMHRKYAPHSRLVEDEMRRAGMG